MTILGILKLISLFLHVIIWNDAVYVWLDFIMADAIGETFKFKTRNNEEYGLTRAPVRLSWVTFSFTVSGLPITTFL